MERAAFLKELGSVLRVDAEAAPPGLRLEEVVWDSLAVMSTVALIDEHSGLTVSGDDLARCETLGDILKMAGL
jgi:acyl carrier protein